MTTTAAPPYVYGDTVKLPGDLSLDTTLQAVAFLNETCEARFDGVSEFAPGIAFCLTFDAVDDPDLWDVREVLHDIERGLAALGIEYTADKARLS